MVLVMLAWLIGLAWQLQQPDLMPQGMRIGGILLGLGLVLAARWFTVGRVRSLLIFGALALLGFVSTDWRAAHYRDQGLLPEHEGRNLELTGLIASMPQRNENGLRFRFEVEQAEFEGQPIRIPALIELGWYGTFWRGDEDVQAQAWVPPLLKAGERWRLSARLKAPHGARNPHGFDYELYLWEQGVQATGYVRIGPRDALPQRLGATWNFPVQQLRQRVRDSILSRLSKGAADSADSAELKARLAQSGVVAALVTGDQRVIDRADWDVFRATGVAHLMSISGLHITMFAWLASALCGWLWRRSSRLCLAWPAQHAGALAGLMLAGIYALFSGWGVPAQRTILMLATVIMLRLSARQWPWWVIWLLAMFLVTLVDPWALLQPGFWLSFVAVGVLFLTDSGQPLHERRKLMQPLLALLREQSVITLALTPLTLLLFGQVSLIGFFANLLAIPWVTGVVTPLSMLGMVWPGFWDWAAFGVQALSMVLRYLASLPLASLTLAQAPLWVGLIGLLGGVLLVVRLPLTFRLLGLPLILPLLLWQPVRPPPGEFDLLATDIGQGNAVLVQTAHHALLYDAGPRYSLESDAGHRVLLPLLRAFDIRLDKLVLSHRDSDHTGGAAAVLAMQPQADLLSSLEDQHPLHQIRPGKRCEAGQTWNWDGVRFEILRPQAVDYGQLKRTNALSCVLRIQSGSASALLAGDIERNQEIELVNSGATLKSDLLLVPHHGSKTSSSPEFLDAVAAHTALVQAGYRNRFGHPAEVVMARYQDRKIRVHDSAHCGAAHWRSIAPGEVNCQRESARRYWQHQPG